MKISAYFSAKSEVHGLILGLQYPIFNIQRRSYVSLVFISWSPILMQVVIYAYWSYFYFLEVVSVSA